MDEAKVPFLNAGSSAALGYVRIVQFDPTDRREPRTSMRTRMIRFF